jgi:hypothetical protein
MRLEVSPPSSCSCFCCRGRDAGYPAPPAQIPAGGFSRTGLFRSTRSRMCRRAFPGEQEPQDSLTKTELLLARHLLTHLFHDPRARYLEAFHQAVHSPPRQTPSLTSPVQPFVERPARFLMGELHAAVVADQPIVVPRPLQLGPECFHHPAQPIVTVFSDPVSYALRSGSPFLGGRASFDSRFALPVGFPVKLKSQKVEPPIVWPAIVAEAQRLGFVRCHFQPEPGQPCLERLIKDLGFMAIFEATCRSGSVRLGRRFFAPAFARASPTGCCQRTL